MNRFLFLVVLVLVLPLSAQAPQPRYGLEDAPGPRMRSRAVIRILPMRLLEEERARTAEILELLHTMAMTRVHINSGDPVVRQQLELESRLTEAVRVHLDHDASDEGKGATALAVQRKLNAIEGQAQCSACHGGPSMEFGSTR